MDIIRNEGCYIVVCDSIKSEYMRHLYGRSTATYWLLNRDLYRLREEGILKDAEPIDQDQIVVHRKDQHVIDCALNRNHPAHIIITDDLEHFESVALECRLPIVVCKDDFIDKNTRQNSCSEVKKLLKETKKYGMKAILVKRKEQ